MPAKKSSAPKETEAPAQEEKPQAKTRLIIIRRYWWIGLCLIAVIGIGTGGYFYYQYQQAKTVLGNSTAAAQAEQQNLVEKVGKLIVLPQGEQPTIAIVSDVTKLRNQPFFSSAVNGDRVLIYAKAKKAILYDPVANKIKEIGPVDLGQPSVTPTASAEVVIEPVKVAIYNGTRVSGLASSVEKQLSEISSTQYVTVSKGNAVKRNHTKTIVIDLSGKHQAEASKVAGIVKGEVATELPEGEKAPKDADILVIVGKQ